MDRLQAALPKFDEKSLLNATFAMRRKGLRRTATDAANIAGRIKRSDTTGSRGPIQALFVFAA
jgi:hypothetical protein